MQPDKHTLKITDQIGKEITLPFPPVRIVSLVPSQTELLFDLGLGERIAGVTWFCIHPKEAKTRIQVGGTKKLKLDVIASLKPDLIIANKEENEKEQVEWLAERYPVWTSDIKNLDDALDMISSAGQMTGTTDKALEIQNTIKENFAALKPGPPKKALYLIWRDPYMSIGADTFISHMMQRCGLINVMGSQNRYPELNAEDMKALNPDVVLLSSEPFPFKEKHIEEIKTILPGAEVKLVDGEMFSWYGSRLVEAGEYLERLAAELA